MDSPVVEVIVTDTELYADLGNNPLVRGSEGSAAVDLRSAQDFSLMPGDQITVDSGLRIWIANRNFVGIVLPRSGLGTKLGLVLGNGTGIIDSDYQGPLLLCLTNRNPPVKWGVWEGEKSPEFATRGAVHNAEPIHIRRGERVAQYLVMPVILPNFTTVKEFSNSTERGNGGFGSTGT